MKVTVITVSDRAYSGEYEDLSGPVVEELLRKNFEGNVENFTVKRLLVPDEAEKISEALENSLDSDFIFTTGGTGLTKRDITPEICEKFCEKAVLGISETLRAESYKQTPNAMLSRGYAGVKGSTLVVNFPGSPKAAKLCTEIIIPVMQHVMELLK